jgi:PEP-CTERM motif
VGRDKWREFGQPLRTLVNESSPEFTMRTCSMLVKPIALAALLYAGQASAAFYVGDTSGGPTFNRPLEDLTALSGLGTAVAYETYSFSVDTAGSYSFRSFALPLATPWDNFLILYTGAFNPGSALTNVTIANDDLNNNVGRSGFSASLSTGVAYTLVTTSFYNEDSGRYLNVIRGPGDLTAPVPEPETYLMLVAGLAAVGFMARRRRVA